MKFFSLDVETANSDSATICQVGIGIFENGRMVDTWESLVNPQSSFHWGNVRVHGINGGMVMDAPVFSEVYPVIRRLLSGNVVVYHTSNKPFAAFGVAHVAAKGDSFGSTLPGLKHELVAN